jgi:hypothetical protein
VVVPYGGITVTESLFTKAGVPAGVVCPMPDAWHKLFQIIKPLEMPSSSLKNPLILGGWDTSPETKQERFEEHLTFALKVGIWDEVADYLKTLSNNQWYRG